MGNFPRAGDDRVRCQRQTEHVPVSCPVLPTWHLHTPASGRTPDTQVQVCKRQQAAVLCWGDLFKFQVQ